MARLVYCIIICVCFCECICCDERNHFCLCLQDYYSIAPFATPTTALTGRDGGLTNNPYSGELVS